VNTHRVNAAAGVIHAAMQRGKTLPQTLAYDLEAAGLLQSPETADELSRLRTAGSRLPVDDERIALIRRGRTHCEATRFETQDERPLHVWGPSQYPGRDMCQRCTTERAWAEDVDADEVVLLAEVDRLRARVAELEAALALDPDPIAYGPRGYRCGCGKDAHSSLTPCRPDPEPLAGTVRTLARMAEDPHDSPLHTDYRLGHDLPEVPHG